MKAWISKWLMFVSAGHTVIGAMLFGSIYMQMFSVGLVGSVTSDKTAAAAWFLLFGFLLFTTSLLIGVIEKSDNLEMPKSIGITLFALTTIGVILMPASGFWLAYPAAIALLINQGKTLEPNHQQG
jgi:hypothetical protein